MRDRFSCEMGARDTAEQTEQPTELIGCACRQTTFTSGLGRRTTDFCCLNVSKAWTRRSRVLSKASREKLLNAVASTGGVSHRLGIPTQLRVSIGETCCFIAVAGKRACFLRDQWLSYKAVLMSLPPSLLVAQIRRILSLGKGSRTRMVGVCW